MTSKGQNNQEERVLILAPIGRDAVMTARVLSNIKLKPEICANAEELCRKIKEDAGLVFLTGEALTPETMSILVETLLRQPPWSDIPLIVLTSGGSENPANAEILEELAEVGNVTLIERPVRLMTLISAVRSVLRARRRQYEARDFLAAEIETGEALQQSEKRLRVALDAARLGAWQINLKTLEAEASDICKANFGLEPEANFHFDDLLPAIHPDDRERVAREFEQAIKNREEYKSEYRVIWRNGSVHWIFSRGSVNYDKNGAPQNVVGVTLDITERKEAEKQREKLLEREQAARSAAESANRLKDEFLATISHELRTPLNAMLGWASLLRSGQLSQEESARALNTIERNARAQAEIIEDLLDVSRIITGKLSLEIKPVEPVSLVRAVIESLQPTAAARKINITQKAATGISLIMGDSARIQQIIWNLLSNAIKFTPQGGQVEIDLLPENEYLTISVRDNGQGIEPEFLPFVFDRFLQADGTTTRTYGGLGLGLAIVRHLVELHGGIVQAESDGEGKGATFTVKLPLMPERIQKSETNGHLPIVSDNQLKNEACNDLKGLKILAVDDEADSLELIKIFLERCGAKVLTASSVSEALIHLDTSAPDVLVSDIGMPEADGYELIKKIRALPPERGGNIPAVALTAYARSEDKIRAVSSGFQTHLSKPFEIEDLLKTISGVINKN
jgi:PAS domain S-box-containing protein